MNEEIQIKNCPNNLSIVITNLQGQTIPSDFIQNYGDILVNPTQLLSEGMHFINIVTQNETKAIAVQIKN